MFSRLAVPFADVVAAMVYLHIQISDEINRVSLWKIETKGRIPIRNHFNNHAPISPTVQLAARPMIISAAVSSSWVFWKL